MQTYFVFVTRYEAISTLAIEAVTTEEALEKARVSIETLAREAGAKMWPGPKETQDVERFVQVELGSDFEVHSVNVATVDPEFLAACREHKLPRVWRPSDYDPQYDTDYSDYD